MEKITSITEKITYVVHAFQRSRKQQEEHFATLEEAHAYAVYLGNAFDCVVLAYQRPESLADARKGRLQGGFLTSLIRSHTHTWD